MRFFTSFLLILMLLAADQPRKLDPKAATPPVANRIPKEMVTHGETRVDPYFWMREKTNPEVIRHLEAENAYAAAVMKPTENLQKILYDEMLGRIKQTDLDVPVKRGEYLYYMKTEQGKQYPIHCRKKDEAGAVEENILDSNAMAEGKKFFSLNPIGPSDDGNLFAFTTDITGFREYALQVKDLRSGEILADKVEKVAGVAWAGDNATLFYSKEDAAKRPAKIFRHTLGSKDQDPLVQEETDELYRINVRRSHDKKYIFLESMSGTTSEAKLIPADRPEATPQVILAREEGHEYHVDHREGLFYFRSNKGAKDFKIARAPVAKPDQWTDFVPAKQGTTIEGLALFAKHAVATERMNGLTSLRVIPFDDTESHNITFTEPTYEVAPDQNPEYETATFRFRYLSFVTPSSVYDYDLVKRTRELMKQTEIPGGYNPADYISERIFATAPDGTKVPISLVYKKGLKRDGKAPCLLYGYGSYGITMPVAFNSARLSLLDRGVTYGLAHIRGGSDMGRAWKDDGKLLKKIHTFTDFIACADHLVAEKYTSHDKLAIQGGSAGGLLIGATINLRPDVARVAILQVPFVDVINTMLDPTLPLTIQEYLEWGNPNEKASYDYMKSYCPYTNLSESKDYPATLVMTALNDSQVMYWEPVKYVAKMRSIRKDGDPLVFKINMDAGHGGASGRYDALKETAFIDAFLLKELGVE